MHFFQKTNQKFWTLEVLILLLFLLKYDRFFLQLSFCETNFTWRNDITCKNVLNKPICDEIHKSALSWVLHVAYFYSL